MESCSPADRSAALLDQGHLAASFRSVRDFTFRLCEPLEAEDCCIQSMPDVSPTRWHLAHTTWFFEQFLLEPRGGYRAFDPHYAFLFNSYYNTVGAQFPRSQRGLLSRPTVAQVWDYRRAVDSAVLAALAEETRPLGAEEREVLLLGVHHEQQHQELLLTDIKHVLGQNPLRPLYRPTAFSADRSAPALAWREFPEGIVEVGFSGEGFSYDNETPRHRVFLESFRLANRLTTCGEYAEFIADNGYQRPELWLSAGWATCCEHRWTAPLYWFRDGAGPWSEFTLAGPHRVDPQRPVCHVSFFEAEAFARWAGKRLPSEAEWEVAAATAAVAGRFADTLLNADQALHPQVAASSQPANSVTQLYGDVWEWTASPYVGYPGYRPAAGALGEYNGKFMCNQFVLRGGSCATHSTHIRPTYRNFFAPAARWQFSGIRLAD